MKEERNRQRIGIMDPMSPNSIELQRAKADAQPNRTDEAYEEKDENNRQLCYPPEYSDKVVKLLTTIVVDQLRAKERGDAVFSVENLRETQEMLLLVLQRRKEVLDENKMEESEGARGYRMSVAKQLLTRAAEYEEFAKSLRDQVIEADDGGADTSVGDTMSADLLAKMNPRRREAIEKAMAAGVSTDLKDIFAKDQIYDNFNAEQRNALFLLMEVFKDGGAEAIRLGEKRHQEARLFQLQNGGGPVISVGVDHPAYPRMIGCVHRDLNLSPISLGTLALKIIRLNHEVQQFALDHPDCLREINVATGELATEVTKKLIDLNERYELVGRDLQDMIQTCHKNGDRQHAEVLMSYVSFLERIYERATSMPRKILVPGLDPLDLFHRVAEDDFVFVAGLLPYLFSVVNDQELQHHFELLQRASFEGNERAVARAKVNIILDVMDHPRRATLREPRSKAVGSQQLNDLHEAVAAMVNPNWTGLIERLQAVGNRSSQGRPLFSPVEPMNTDGGPILPTMATTAARKVTPEGSDADDTGVGEANLGRPRREFFAESSESESDSEESEEESDDEDGRKPGAETKAIGAMERLAAGLSISKADGEEAIEEETGHIAQINDRFVNDIGYLQAIRGGFKDLDQLRYTEKETAGEDNSLTYSPSEKQSPVEVIHDGYTEDMEIYYDHVRDFYGLEAEAIVRELHRLRENRPESPTPSIFAKASPEFNQSFYDRALHRRSPIMAAKTVTSIHRVLKDMAELGPCESMAEQCALRPEYFQNIVPSRFVLDSIVAASADNKVRIRGLERKFEKIVREVNEEGMEFFKERGAAPAPAPTPFPSPVLTENQQPSSEGPGIDPLQLPLLDGGENGATAFNLLPKVGGEASKAIAAAGDVTLSPISAEIKKCFAQGLSDMSDDEEDEDDLPRTGKVLPLASILRMQQATAEALSESEGENLEKPRLKRQIAGGMKRVPASVDLEKLAQPFSEAEEEILDAREAEEKKSADEQRAIIAERCSKPACLRQMIVDRAAMAKEFTVHMDAEDAWPKWLKYERQIQKMAPFEKVMYMEGDRSFLPDFPVDADSRTVGIDDETINKRRKAEIELIQWAAPALADHLDFYGTWPGPFKAIRQELREEQELLEGSSRPTKRVRGGKALPGGDGK